MNKLLKRYDWKTVVGLAAIVVVAFVVGTIANSGDTGVKSPEETQQIIEDSFDEDAGYDACVAVTKDYPDQAESIKATCEDVFGGN